MTSMKLKEMESKICFMSMSSNELKPCWSIKCIAYKSKGHDYYCAALNNPI